MEVQPYCFLTAVLSRLDVQQHAPAVKPQGNSHSIPGTGGLVGPGVGLDGCGEEENVLPSSEFEFQTVQHVAGSYTHCIITACTYSNCAACLTLVFCPQHVILVPAQCTSERKRSLPFWEFRQEAQSEPSDISILSLFLSVI